MQAEVASEEDDAVDAQQPTAAMRPSLVPRLS